MVVDLIARQLYSSDVTPLGSILAKRRDTLILPIQIRGTTGELIELGPEDEIIVAGKEVKKYSQAYFCKSTTFEREGEGASAKYWVYLDLNTAQIEGKFPDDNAPNLALSFEVQVTWQGRRITPTNATLLTIENDYVQGGEGGPLNATPPWLESDQYLAKPDNLAGLANLATARQNLGLERMLFRNPVPGPVSFGDEGEEGDYWYDPELSVLWAYLGGGWVNTTFFNQQ